MAPDAVVSQALGPAAHSFQAVRTPDLEMCAVVEDESEDPLTIFRIHGSLNAGDIPGVPGQATGIVIDATPVDGIGDSAALIHLQASDGALLSLRVQRGDNVYAFIAKDALDSQPKLFALAQAVIANLRP